MAIAQITCDIHGDVSVQTILDKLNQIINELNGLDGKLGKLYVKKSGDTMTGSLKVFGVDAGTGTKPGSADIWGSRFLIRDMGDRTKYSTLTASPTGDILIGGNAILTDVTGLMLNMPGNVTLESATQGTYFVKNSSGTHLDYDSKGTDSLTYRRNKIWHAGITTGIKAVRTGNVLRMTTIN